MRNNLTEFRHKLGLTQEEFAGLFNTDRQYQNNVEKGRRTGSADYWLGIMGKFNLTYLELIKLKEVSTNETA